MAAMAKKKLIRPILIAMSPWKKSAGNRKYFLILKGNTKARPSTSSKSKTNQDIIVPIGDEKMASLMGNNQSGAPSL